jgi:hypothetical protein
MDKAVATVGMLALTSPSVNFIAFVPIFTESSKGLII